jgi:hypothetical protein
MLIQDKYAFDKASARSLDSNGYMHVAVSNLTKEQVVPYMGDSIPGYKELGLQPDKVYQIYRPAEEIEKAAETFNGLPLMLDHWAMDAANIPKDKVVGSLGTDAKWAAPYLTNSLIVTDANAIKAIEDGSYAELSASYACDIDMTGGVFDGKTYDGVMRNIKGNHVALVPEGRAGHDVKVADSAMGGGEHEMNWMEKFKELLFDIITDKEAMKDIMNENEKIEKQQAPAQQNPAPAQATDVEPVDELADEIREKMVAAGLDPEDKAAQKAFIAGMAAGKAADEGEVEGQASDKEEKAADGEGEGACTDGEEEKAADECGKANDAAIVHDKAFYAGLYKAAEDVAPFVGKISNPFAFDSAADIYKKALDKAGVVTDGIDPSAFGAMVSMLNKPAAIPQGVVEEDPLNKRLMGIKSN